MARQTIAVVSGSNKGIGLEVVRQLCEKRAFGIVYLTDKDEGIKSVKELQAKNLNPLYHQLDITDQASVDKFANHLKENHGKIDCLVNNAGISTSSFRTNQSVAHSGIGAQEQFLREKENVENIVKTNFHGTLRLCRALFPLLSHTARVVNVTSSMGHLLKINGKEPQASELRRKFASEDLTEEELVKMMDEYVRLVKEDAHLAVEAGFPNSVVSGFFSPYVMSKVGVSALTRMMQRAVSEKVLVNHVHPGYVNTDMTFHKGPDTVEKGAKPIVWAATLPEDSDVKGQFIWKDCSIIDWVATPLPEPV